MADAWRDYRWRQLAGKDGLKKPTHRRGLAAIVQERDLSAAVGTGERSAQGSLGQAAIY